MHPPRGQVSFAALNLHRRVTVKMVLSVTAAVLLARTLLQGAARTLAKHATDELYQLTVIAFCLVGAWISGYLVSRGIPRVQILRHTTQLTQQRFDDPALGLRPVRVLGQCTHYGIMVPSADRNHGEAVSTMSCTKNSSGMCFPTMLEPQCGVLQGLSTELGAFVAGVMLSTTDQQENALQHLEQARRRRAFVACAPRRDSHSLVKAMPADMAGSNIANSALAWLRPWALLCVGPRSCPRSCRGVLPSLHLLSPSHKTRS